MLWVRSPSLENREVGRHPPNDSGRISWRRAQGRAGQGGVGHRAGMRQAGGSLTGSCHLLRTEGRSPPASERPLPSAARRGEGAGRPPRILEKGKRLVREGRGLGSSDKDRRGCSSGSCFYHRHVKLQLAILWLQHFPQNDISSVNPQHSCGAGATSPFHPRGAKTDRDKRKSPARGHTINLRLLLPPG